MASGTRKLPVTAEWHWKHRAVQGTLDSPEQTPMFRLSLFDALCAGSGDPRRALSKQLCPAHFRTNNADESFENVDRRSRRLDRHGQPCRIGARGGLADVGL